MKQEEESARKKEMKKTINTNVESKREKAKKEFNKWLKKKHTHKTEKATDTKLGFQISNAVKTKEESEKAFRKWKNKKDKQHEDKKNEIKMEKEKKMKLNREKEKKKILAKQAFQQWTSKIKKKKKLDVQKNQAGKQGKPRKTKYKYQKNSENELSFFAWKKAKDKEISVKAKQNRESVKLAREKNLALAEERLLKAHQAFENWLENVDGRKKKQLCKSKILHNSKPWLPL